MGISYGPVTPSYRKKEMWLYFLGLFFASFPSSVK